MSESVRTIKVGQAVVSIIHIGDIYLPLADHMNITRADLKSRDDLHGLAEQDTIPIQFFHIQLPHTSVLVDAGVYDVDSDPQYAIPNYVPPPSLVDSLNEIGIQPEDIDHIIITHAHWDHFNGTTVEDKGQFIPQFPNATVYLGRADWEATETARQDAHSVESRTLQVLHDSGRLQLVDAQLDVVDGIQIIPSPGETRGHQIVRVHSDGETLYCLGDLYHHLSEFVEPDWMVTWADNEAIIDSRHALSKRAFAENALLVATHITLIGKLRDTGERIIWEPITSS